MEESICEAILNASVQDISDLKMSIHNNILHDSNNSNKLNNEIEENI